MEHQDANTPSNQEGSISRTLTTRTIRTTLFVDRASRQWIALDAEGRYWAVPPELTWMSRRPFEPNEETQLERVPGYYKPMLGVPF